HHRILVALASPSSSSSLLASPSSASPSLASPSLASPAPPLSDRTPLMPPEPQSFTSLQQVKDYCAQHSKLHGYAIVTERSKPKKLYMKCDRGGQYRNWLKHTEASRVRSTSTKLAGCPFKCTATLFIDTWTLEVQNPHHNHD